MEMTLEDLALAINGGRTDLMTDLWERVQPFIKMKAFAALCLADREYPGAELEDLTQEGYFALKRAVDSYKPEHEHRFLTHLGYHLKTSFAGVLGYRTSKRDLIKKCTSLDIPINDDEPEGETRLDFLPDDSDLIADKEDQIYQEQLREALEGLIGLLNPKGADIIRSYYFAGESARDIARRWNTTLHRGNALRDSYVKQLRSMSRYSKEGWRLRKFLADE